jgi:hypothetical protein
MPAMQLLTILELLESTLPVHQDDPLAAHRHHIMVLEELLSRLVSFGRSLRTDYSLRVLQLEYKHTKQEIREDRYVRRLYLTLGHSLRTAYFIAQTCSPLANHRGFEVKQCDNYWKLVDTGEEAGIM